MHHASTNDNPLPVRMRSRQTRVRGIGTRPRRRVADRLMIVVGSTLLLSLLLATAHLALDDAIAWWLVGSGLATGLAGTSVVALRRRSDIAWRSASSSNQQGAIGTVTLSEGDLPSVHLGAVLQSLADTAESRDSQTHGHCERVAVDSVTIGTLIGLSEEELNTLYWAALLHDVGKLAVAQSVLTKSGRLTSEELEEIRRHPTYGADLLMGISPHLEQVAAAVRSHHERWDGKGYPQGISGDQIPLLARIVSVIDVYEALTSPRPYRDPLLPGQALVYIRRGSGTQFDPRVVAAFERLHASGRLLTTSSAGCRECAPDTLVKSSTDGLTT